MRQLVCCASLFLLFASAEATEKTPHPAPELPGMAQMAAAKTIFIADDAADPGPINYVYNSIYDRFYAAMRQWGRYKILSSPEGADLILGVRGDARLRYIDDGDYDIGCPAETPPASCSTDHTSSECYYKPASACREFVSEIVVVARDGATDTFLWEFNQPYSCANKHRRHKHSKDDRFFNFDQALDSLVAQIAAKTGHQGETRPLVLPVREPVPLPARIAEARKIFIGNMGTEDEETWPVSRGKDAAAKAPEGEDGAGPGNQLAYDEFYALMKTWGRYELLPSPAGADLVFLIDLHDHHLTLDIYEPRAPVRLWHLKWLMGVTKRAPNYVVNVQTEIAWLTTELARLSGDSKRFLGRIAAPPAAPAPVSISAARKVFIANGGLLFVSLGKGRSDRMYGDFAAALRQWGKYELVDSPGAADLVLQIQCGFQDPRLVVLDPATGTRLWALSVKYPIVSWKHAPSQDEYRSMLTSLVNQLALLSGNGREKPAVADRPNPEPIAAPLAAARRVYVGYPAPASFELDADSAPGFYQKVYDDIRALGRFELVSTPGEADLVVDLTLQKPWIKTSIIQPLFLQIELRDPRRQIVLWGAAHDQKEAFRQVNIRKNFNLAIAALIEEVRKATAAHGPPETVKQSLQ